MSCGNCQTCSCKSTFKSNSYKFLTFNGYLAKIHDKCEYSGIYEPMARFEENDHFLMIFNATDGHFEIRPHYEFSDYSQTVELMQNDSTCNVYDEHGKLIAVMQLIIKDGEWREEIKIEYTEYDRKSENILALPNLNARDENIKDYILKRLILRYIAIIENEGVIKPVKNQYGSDKLEHLLWMLKDIYKKQPRNLLERYIFLGYIQGVLRCKNLIDVRHERDTMSQLV